MKGLFKNIDTIIRWIEDAVAATALIAIVTIAAANTIGRYVPLPVIQTSEVCNP